MSLDFGQINWLAVIVAAVAAFMVGGVWYGVVFEKAWVQSYGFREDELKEMAAKQPRNFGIFFAGSTVIACVLSLLLAALEINTAAEAAAFGGLLWLGLLATMGAAQTAATNKPLKLYLITAGHQLAEVVTISAILGAWR
ncbi:MAG: DUF1761 domain-containing protein [Phycisphaerales bacterium]|nr:DUF1761 domain-containing protein [Phycisphaerales bacterium]